MENIIYVTGGSRSGKSKFAEDLVSKFGDNICYIATAKAIDPEMQRRIEIHKNNRSSNFKTIEAYKNFKQYSDIFKNYDGILLDCVTIMITNIIFDMNIDLDNIETDMINILENTIIDEFINLLSLIQSINVPFVFVSNELGMGLVPESKFSRIFRDLAGKVNQLIAKQSSEAYFVVSGIPIKLK